MRNFGRIFYEADKGDNPPIPPKEEEKEVKEVEGKEEPKKTYSEEDLNGIIARKTKEAKTKALEEAGITPEEIKSWKEEKEASKTATQKMEDALKAEKTGRTTDQQERDLAKAELTAIKAGCDPKRSDKLVKLAMTYEGETISEKVASALKDFPTFKLTGEPFGGKPKNEADNDTEKMKATLNDIFGLKSSK